jgi:hypothetical protein
VEALYREYKNNDKVAILLVYIREAHPARESTRPVSGDAASTSYKDIAQPKNLDERVIAADKCMRGLKFTLPILIDNMQGVVQKAYSGLPAATAVVDMKGKIAFYSRGPNGAQPQKAKAVIDRLLKAE